MAIFPWQKKLEVETSRDLLGRDALRWFEATEVKFKLLAHHSKTRKGNLSQMKKGIRPITGDVIIGMQKTAENLREIADELDRLSNQIVEKW